MQQVNPPSSQQPAFPESPAELEAQTESANQQAKSALQTKQSAVADKIAAIRAEARAKALEMFRAESGVGEPAVPMPQPPVSRPPVPAPATPAETPEQMVARIVAQSQVQKPAVDPSALAAARQEAAEARAKLAAMEELLATRPTEALKQKGWTDDKLQAHLLNGGQPSPEEQLAAAVAKAKAEAKAEAEAVVKAELAQYQHAQLRQSAVAELAPMLEAYPVTAHFAKPGEIVEHYREVVQQEKAAGRPVPDIHAYLKAREAWHIETYKAPLQNEKVAAILAPGSKSSNQAAAAGPSTLHNRVTSAVAPSAPRPGSEAERIARGRAEIQKLFSGQ